MAWKTRSRRMLLCGVTAMLTAPVPALAKAQAQDPAPASADPATASTIQAAPSTPPASPEDDRLGDIVVTAQKRSENLQDVPISITAVSGDSLAARNVLNAVDFGREIPNIQIKSAFSATNPTIFIRGIGINDFNPSSAGAIGVLIDEVFLNSTTGQLVQFYDIDRVEVLKGPQGTLYGRNTTGGVVNFFTRRPGFTIDPSLSVTYGRYNEVNVEAASSIPIVDDKVAGRISFLLKRRDGWLRNDFDGSRLNDVDQTAIRGQLLVRPSSQLEILGKFEAGFNRSSFYQGQGLGVIDPASGGLCSPSQILRRDICSNLFGYTASRDTRRTSVNFPDPNEDLDSYTGRLGVTWNGEAVTVNSITAYVSNKSIVRQDTDNSPFRVTEQPYTLNDARQWTQELRITSSGDTRLKWLVGGYFLHETLDAFNSFELFADANPTPTLPYLDLTGATTGGLPVFRVDSFYRQKTRSYAVFGQVSYQLTDRLTATAGARYSWDHKTIALQSVFGPTDPVITRQPIANPICCLVGDPASADPATGLPTRPILDSRDDNKPIWRFALDYKPNDNLLLYGSYARGVRAGGFNGGATVDPGEYSRVSPERVDAFEAGFKSDLLDRRLRFNGAAFYYRGKLQVFTLLPTTLVGLQILDSATIEGYGAEADIQARPLAGLDLRLSGGYFHGEYVAYPGRPENVGNRVSNAPRFSLAASARYEVDVSPNWQFNIGGDVTYQSKIFFQPSNDPVLAQDGYALVNGRIGFTKADSKLDVFVWVKNLFDKVYLSDIYDVSSSSFYQANYSVPRTFGLTAAIRY